MGLNSLSQRIIGANTIIQGALADILKNTPKCFFADTVAYIDVSAPCAADDTATNKQLIHGTEKRSSRLQQTEADAWSDPNQTGRCFLHYGSN